MSTMIQNSTEEKILNPKNGLTVLVLLIMGIVASVVLTLFGASLAADPFAASGLGIVFIFVGFIAFVVFLVMCAGLKIVKPNEALVLSLFGKYYGTIYKSGFYHVNPFCSAIYPRKRDEEAQAKAKTGKNSDSSSAEVPTAAKRISTKLSTFVNGAQKVNDKLGNPIEVSAIVIWKVVNATKAVINIDNYNEYLSNQTDSIIRNVARLYPYDIVDDNDDDDDAAELTLRGSASLIAEQMKKELSAKVEDAGIEIVDVRLNQIAYATEIAAAMLQRQQAVAVIAARKKIVEGAVSMVEMALDQLKKDGVVDLDEERKAQMVSNLLVVLCGSKEANPVVNAGSIY